MTSRERYAQVALVAEPVVTVAALLAVADSLRSLASAAQTMRAEAILSTAEAPNDGPTTTRAPTGARLARPRPVGGSAVAVRDRLTALLADLLRQAGQREARGESGDDQ
jgi:hypothetical protein